MGVFVITHVKERLEWHLWGYVLGERAASSSVKGQVVNILVFRFMWPLLLLLTSAFVARRQLRAVCEQRARVLSGLLEQNTEDWAASATEIDFSCFWKLESQR